MMFYLRRKKKLRYMHSMSDRYYNKAVMSLTAELHSTKNPIIKYPTKPFLIRPVLFFLFFPEEGDSVCPYEDLIRAQATSVEQFCPLSYFCGVCCFM